MKFITSRDALLRVLGVAQEVITNKSPVSIMSNVLLQTDKENQKVIVKCTNSTVNAISSFGAEIEEEGETTVFCDKFVSVISSLPMGDVEIETGENEILVKPLGKKVKFRIKTLASDKFPVFKGFNSENSIKIAAKDFKNLIKHTSFAVSTDSNRYMMTGCYLTKEDNWLYMVATDGRRMSLCTCADFSPEFTSAIIPVKGLSVIDRICQEEGQIEINTTDKTFFFKGYGYEISSSLIEGQFPMWQKVVPNGLDHTVTISKADLEDAIKRTVIMAAKNGRIQMILDSDKMVISSPENEVGSSKEEIEAKYSGEPAEIALNAMYLSDVLKVIDSDDISIDFKFNQDKKVTSALIVKPEINNVKIEDNKEPIGYTHVIMPMTF